MVRKKYVRDLHEISPSSEMLDVAHLLGLELLHQCLEVRELPVRIPEQVLQLRLLLTLLVRQAQ